MALVGNGSHRPIRDIACRLYTLQDDKLYKSEYIGLAPPIERSDSISLKDSLEIDETLPAKMRLLRAGDIAAFIFNLIVNPDLDEILTLRFTDDAGLHWQIDHDLHLQKLDNRDDW